MELILWRHADAEEGTPDGLRKLTQKGEKQAIIMAGWLKPRMPKNTRILVSPAIRAQQTAKALTSHFETMPELGPGASVNAVLDATQWPDSEDPIMVVGHQPTLGRTAAYLLSGTRSDWGIKKGALWWFTILDDSQTVLRAVISPDLVER